MQIKDLVPGVKRKLGNNDNADAFSPIWIRDSIMELTESYPFNELETIGPVLNFTPGVAKYLVRSTTNNNEKPTIIYSWYVSSTTTISSSNNANTGRYLKYRTQPVVNLMSQNVGIPSKWTKHGADFIIGNCPDQGYAFQLMYQREHPFLCDKFDVVGLQNQDVHMPDSWAIIVEFHAAIIGAYELRMNDYAQVYHQALYGDPDFKKTGRGNPGLIFQRTSQYDRDSSQNERQIQMVVMKSCG
jgi:hypothetical protein